MVIFESTGHYHSAVIQYLEERGITIYFAPPPLLFHYQGYLLDLEDRIVTLANELKNIRCHIKRLGTRSGAVYWILFW